METVTIKKKRRTRAFSFALCSLIFVLCSCGYGQLGGADQTEAYYPEDPLFEERLSFLCGVWYSHEPSSNINMDGYRIRKWSTLTNEDKARAQALFSGINFNAGNPKTYSTKDYPKNNDYVVLFDDYPGGTPYGFGYMGLVRAINIFNYDAKRGAVIIEYFEGADPLWLSDPDGYSYQGLARGEKPFFGIYYKVLDSDTVQMANAIKLDELYSGNHYYTEQGTLYEAIATFNVENEAEFIDWGVAFPQIRER
jgi:hypothetical protein